MSVWYSDIVQCAVCAMCMLLLQRIGEMWKYKNWSNLKAFYHSLPYSIHQKPMHKSKTFSYRKISHVASISIISSFLPAILCTSFILLLCTIFVWMHFVFECRAFYCTIPSLKLLNCEWIAFGFMSMCVCVMGFLFPCSRSFSAQ